MIKAEVNVTGTIRRNAAMRTDKSGKNYLAFMMGTNLPDSMITSHEIEIHVTDPDGQQDDLDRFVENTRVAIHGTMNVRKKDEKLVFYLTPNLIHTENVSGLDSLSGSLSFLGHLKSESVYEEKKDKNGNPFLVFSAYSSEKVGEEFIKTWVSFMRFPEKDAGIETILPAWMKAKSKVRIDGDFQLESYNGRVRISSRVREMSQYVPQTNNPFNE